MNKNPLVSVVTVVYNGETTIKYTIESVLNQTYNNIEYIIIDGNSTDNTLKIIKEYGEKFKENGIVYKWISEPDNGIYNAMNKGINLTKGELIGIINSDDWYELNAVELVVKEYLKDKDFDVFHGNINIIKNEVVLRTLNPKTDYHTLWKDMILFHPTCFVTKNVYSKIGVFDENYIISSDYDFILRCYINNFRFYYIDKIISNMRTGGISDKQVIDSWKECRDIANKNGLNNTLSKLYYFRKRIIRIFLKYIYPEHYG
ncbi:glycosyltransferase involved in cell wall biosynthesis [Methanococcus maripaludis]|uniref:Glycosyltransferase involved in cell wall biosynthesis n=1 Tax=Methanococcus maripaludis TaxID=39152 RepID=A0A7J9NNF3_METMI|nr:glycosyltransferase family 2 protein [Methanococcus maripaludis]MBA2846975.1 glycosyltransferase involved in cell wall biosynthesis [Methanococcus maripaludis]